MPINGSLREASRIVKRFRPKIFNSVKSGFRVFWGNNGEFKVIFLCFLTPKRHILASFDVFCV